MTLTASVTSSATRANGDSWPRIGQSRAGTRGRCGRRVGRHRGHGTESLRRRRYRSRVPASWRRTAGDAGSLARPRPAGPPRRGPRPSATRRSTSACAAARASSAAVGRARRRLRAAHPDDQGELAARRDRAVGRGRRPASPSVPRTICSWILVSSRQTAPRRSAPQAAARSRSVAATRPGASYSTDPRGSAAIAARRSRRSRPDRGRNPSNAQRGPATPDAATAARTAEAPGIGTTRPPSSAQAATRSAPGSLTPGRAGIGHEREVRPRPQVLQQGG